ncbi:unnamed protein product [Phaedon cochleariae]|uniref:Protein hunchback n=1 Tax=Phaedon cochleariae TaxID=80249 RepID=A0A9P0GYA6_PHACE|nr:unnamed protein product [Phaedon cochleariae]
MRGGVSYEMTSTCVQGGIRPLAGYQPNMLMEPSSPASAWQYSVIPKREPIDHEDRNDSGMGSGGDFASSSPGSECDNFNIPYSSPTTSQMDVTVHHPAYFSTPMTRPSQSLYAHQHQNIDQMRYNNDHHNPLTPPSSEPLASPNSRLDTKTDGSEHHTTLTPCASPAEGNANNFTEHEDPLRRLQMSLEKNGFLPPALSPKFSECSGEDDNKSDNDIDEYDEQGLKIPKVNSHGKVKTFKCKQCDFVAITKLDFWEHNKGHIKADKLLTCPKCPFVTEYKHHLEYHLRNHFGSKPFKCSQCNYSCVNKSMLNSHLKSHSNVYQYRCSDCSYATKYCHSLKLHLRKYGHKPAMVLNPDGTPNPLPIIDVYGTRRGPKVKQQEQKALEENSPKHEQMLPFPLNQFMLNTPPQMQLPFPGFPFFAGFPGSIPNPLLLQNLEKFARENQGAHLASPAAEDSSLESKQADNEVLDLSKPEEPAQKNRRKGRAFKLKTHHDHSSEGEEETTTTIFANVEVVEDEEAMETSAEKEKVLNNNNKDDYSCQYCQIQFGEPVLYTMHMGYHGYKNPFTCNMCGEECKDKVSFFLHIARTPHS